MPKNGAKSITINEKVFDKMNLSSQKVSFFLETYLEESEKLRRFTSKITTVPTTVRVYAPGELKK